MQIGLTFQQGRLQTSDGGPTLQHSACPVTARRLDLYLPPVAAKRLPRRSRVKPSAVHRSLPAPIRCGSSSILKKTSTLQFQVASDFPAASNAGHNDTRSAPRHARSSSCPTPPPLPACPQLLRRGKPPKAASSINPPPSGSPCSATRSWTSRWARSIRFPSLVLTWRLNSCLSTPGAAR